MLVRSGADETVQPVGGFYQKLEIEQHMSAKQTKIRWEPQAQEHDYDAARQYLTLLLPDQDAKKVVAQLRRAPTRQFAAKDLLRASQTHLLEKDNDKVHETLKDIKKGEAISPVLLVRGDARLGATLTIADGHHRICASWHWDESCPIACCLAELPKPAEGGKRNGRRS